MDDVSHGFVSEPDSVLDMGGGVGGMDEPPVDEDWDGPPLPSPSSPPRHVSPLSQPIPHASPRPSPSGLPASQPRVESDRSADAGALERKRRGSAGVGVVWRHHLDARGVDISAFVPDFDISMSSRLVACHLRMKNVSVLLLELYLFTGEGLSARNVDLLYAACRVIHCMRMPAMLFGDFQCTAKELLEHEWYPCSRLAYDWPEGGSESAPIPTCGGAPGH